MPYVSHFILIQMKMNARKTCVHSQHCAETQLVATNVTVLRDMPTKVQNNQRGVKVFSIAIP